MKKQKNLLPQPILRSRFFVSILPYFIFNNLIVNSQFSILKSQLKKSFVSQKKVCTFAPDFEERKSVVGRL
jgi:hypothetical protein